MYESRAMTSSKKIAVITTIRGEDFFLDKWIEYYGRELGRKNLYVIVDGHDEVLPDDIKDVNFIWIPHIVIPLVAFEKRRARIISNFASMLFEIFDIVIAVDVDEFIVVDPVIDSGLAEYLSTIKGTSTVSGLGVDLRHNIASEGEFDYSKPVLGQRRFAAIEAKYTKPSIAFEAVQWKSGMHRVHNKHFLIDPNLYLLHLGLFDMVYVKKHMETRGEKNPDWLEHFKRRVALMDEVQAYPAQNAEKFFSAARKHFKERRRLIHSNKPKAISGNNIIEVPERFFGVL